MANVLDVAKFILESCGQITAMKLQKLVYYSQAWNLVWEEEPLFEENIEAWANGAVVPVLYGHHRGMFKVDEYNINAGDSTNLTEPQKINISKVLDFYGGYSAQELSDINHQESPWMDARGDLPAMANCSTQITTAAIFEYHSGIWNES